MPLCLCQPLPCVLPNCVAVCSFLSLGPFRTCSLSCLFCVFLSTTLLEFLFFSIWRCPQPLLLPMLSVCLANFLLGAMLVIATICLARLLLPALPSFRRGLCTVSTALCAMFCRFLVLVSCGDVPTVLSCRSATCKSRRKSVFLPMPLLRPPLLATVAVPETLRPFIQSEAELFSFCSTIFDPALLALCPPVV